MPCEFLRLDATVHVSPQNATSIRAPCPVTTATRSDLAAGLFDFAETASLPKAAQSSFLGQAEEVFKRINPGWIISIPAPYNRRRTDGTLGGSSRTYCHRAVRSIGFLNMIRHRTGRKSQWRTGA